MSEELLFHFHSWSYKLNEGELLDLSSIYSSPRFLKMKFQMVKTIRNLFESSEKAKKGSDFLALLKDATAFVKKIPLPPPPPWKGKLTTVSRF